MADEIKTIKFYEEFPDATVLNPADRIMIGLDSDGTVARTNLGTVKTFISGELETIVDSMIFTEDIIVSLPENYTFGKYKNNDVVPALGKTPKDVIIDALSAILPPSLLLSAQVSVKETGDTSNNLINWAITKTTLPILNFKINNENITISGNTESGTKSITETNTVVGLRTYTGIVSDGENTIQKTTQVRYDNYIYAGAYPSTNLVESDIKSLSSRFASVGNTFTYQTGTTRINFVIACPITKELVSVIDTSNGNFNITQNFIKSNMVLKDAGNNNISYSIYLMTNTVPYSSDSTHSVTLKNI